MHFVSAHLLCPKIVLLIIWGVDVASLFTLFLNFFLFIKILLNWSKSLVSLCMQEEGRVSFTDLLVTLFLLETIYI